MIVLKWLALLLAFVLPWCVSGRITPELLLAAYAMKGEHHG